MGTVCMYATRHTHHKLKLLQDIIATDPTTHGAMFVPIILGSDKTTASVATGQQAYHPVYLSIGNVQNCVRRAHKDGLVLVAFLPIPKGKRLSIFLAIPHLTYNLQAPGRMPKKRISVTSVAVSSMVVSRQ